METTTLIKTSHGSNNTHNVLERTRLVGVLGFDPGGFCRVVEP
jgi:hypothetical protein